MSNDNPGLLEAAATEAPPQQTTEGQEPAINHIQGDPTAQDDEPLERPDFWPEKFWNKDKAEPDLEGISKSYVELEKKFRSGTHKPPEDGKYNLQAAGLAEDDPVAQAYTSWAQKYGISQQAFEDLAKEVTTISGDQEALARQASIISLVIILRPFILGSPFDGLDFRQSLPGHILYQLKV